MSARIELKYTPVGLSYTQCLQIIRQHPVSFVRAFPDRWVNNIYFDTPGLSAYYDNMSGVSVRRKYRIRWYGEDWLSLKNPVMEIKYKENQLGGKQSFDASNFKWEMIHESLDRIMHIGHLPNLQATLCNRYLRSYWKSMDNRFRITLDRSLSFSSPRMGLVLPTYDSDELICELKYDHILRTEADFVQQYLPFRRQRFSKYVHGVITLLAP